jgi:hypothetical protein
MFMCNNFGCINRNIFTGQCNLTACINHQYSNVIVLRKLSLELHSIQLINYTHG